MKSILSALFLVCLSFSAFSQAELSRDCYEKMEEVGLSVLKQVFTPVTDMEQNDALFMAAPGAFRILDLGTDLDVRPQDLQGISLGAGAAYGLRDRWMVYTIYSGVITRGSLEGEFYGLGDTTVPVSLDIHSFTLGTGFDVLSIPPFTIPLFMGFQGQYYNVSMEGDSGNPVYGSFNVTGQGFLWGFSGGAALNISLNRFAITPYYLYMQNFSGAELSAELNILIPLTSSFTMDPYKGGTFGLDVLVESSKQWEFGASIMNLFPQLKWSPQDSGFTSISCYARYSTRL